MYNLKNLNDYEYEVLSMNVMEKILQTRLYRFARGRDGGIDVCDDIRNPRIIIQVKQYSNSRFANLKSAMETELEKIEKLNPEDYFLCTSLELTRSNKNELYEMLQPYMKNISNIIDGIEMNDFLEKEENKEIVMKNYKLWLNSSNVLSLINNQNVFIDCEMLMYDIESQVKNFVETDGYRDALDKIKKQNVIILVGAPGVGKSTISKMILLKYASEGYKIRYTTDNNIAKIKDVLSMDVKCKEIVLLDDFLGQHYLNLKETEPNELKSLLAFIQKNKNKKIILNSRITILQEAQSRYITFNELIEKYDNNIYLINLDKMKKIEKAKIFYNHMFFNNIPKEHFKSIKENDNYFKIIEHRNYNPRIIEYVTKERIIKNIGETKYFDYIMKNLENPKDIWKDEFENRLSIEDRILVYTLYSLTNTNIEINVLKESFNNIIKKIPRLDMTINIFDRTIFRLSNSLISKISDGKKIKIGVLNPSINDYVKNELNNNENLQMQLVDNSLYIEQIIKFIKNNEVNKKFFEKIYNNELLKMKTLCKSPFYYFLEQVFENEIYDDNITDQVQLCFERCYENINEYSYQSDFCDLISLVLEKDSMIQYYKLKAYLLNPLKMNYILDKLYLDVLQEFYEKFEEDLESNTDMLDLLKEKIIYQTERFIQNLVEDEEIYDIVNNNLSNVKYEENELLLEKEKEELLLNVSTEARTYICEQIEENISPFIKFISCEDISDKDILYRVDIEYYIDNGLSNLKDNELVLEEKKQMYENENIEIKNIFDR